VNDSAGHGIERAGLAVKFDKTLRHHARAALRVARGLWWDLCRVRAERPVFVLGCSRAGTTLVYKTLSEAHDLGSLQRETHDFWAALHPPAERDWASHAIPPAVASGADRARVERHFFARTGRRRFVDKNNQNGLCVSYLQALFPDAVFVYVIRGPGDNISSLIEGWLRPEEYGTWSAALPAPVRIDRGAVTRWCFFLAEGWRDYLDAPLEDVCAFQYRAMNEAILAARVRIPEAQWVALRYEELLADPVAGFRRVFACCGLDFGPRIEEHCRTVLARPYNAFSAIKADKWRDGPHAARVARVLPSVREVAAAMGYSD